MNVLLTLLLIFVGFLWGRPTQPLFAATESITISAFVPEKTATSTFAFADGGTFNFTNSNDTQVTFTVPANFYTENLQIQVFAYDKTAFESSKPPPSGKSFVGKVYDFNFITMSGGSVSTLSSAPTMVLHYLDSDVSGLSESTIAPYRRGSNDSSWSLISGSTVDTAANTITFATSTFSSFGILGAPACSDGVDNDGDGKTDYSADPGCSTTSDNDETDPTPEPTPTPSSGGGGGGGGIHIPPFLKLPPPPVSYDFNDDGLHNFRDLSILLFWFGKTGPEISRYDFNKDKKINFVDVSIFLFHWKDK